MTHRNILIIVLLIFSYSKLQSQKPENFGQVTDVERNMTKYNKDSTANAVVLFEKGENYFKVVNQKIRLIKKYHRKIKIFNQKAFDQGTIEIPLYNNSRASEKITHISAVTHNGKQRVNVLPSEIFSNKINERWRETKFTFPKLEPGSIIEYAYTIQTPFDYNLTGWYFQKDIPVIHSEFNAEIPGNWVYNRVLYGTNKMIENKSELKKECFYIAGYGKAADCEVLKYVMKEVPAFKADDDFMLASSNYISRIEFELSEYHGFNGVNKKFTKSWKDVDREFRSDKDIGKQLTKKGFFEKNVPEELLIEGDNLTKAKNIYAFVQKHYTWNEKYGIYGKARVKQAFENQKGNVSEINISLINLLNAAGIKTNLMLLSTRNNGLPKRLQPVMSDFNYCVAKVEIGSQNYILDATDKNMVFGMLPFRALNHYGRVMDFKNDSYWYAIEPEKRNKRQVRVQLKFDVENKAGYGIFDVINLGYSALRTRAIQASKSEEDYVNSYEEGFEGNLSITSYSTKKDVTKPKNISERFEFELDDILNGDTIYFNPILIRFFEQNPFLLEERNYPVDFGYPRSFGYTINIDIPEGYEVLEIPKAKAIQLGDKLVSLKFLTQKNTNQVALTFSIAINSVQIKPEGYEGLKNLFKEVIDIQNNTLLVLKKL